MRVERFSLFFPPTILRVARGETEYTIGAIPAGGYVKITGMNPEEIDGLDPEVVAARLLQPAAVEADRGDLRRAGREHRDRVRAVLGDPLLGQHQRGALGKPQSRSVHERRRRDHLGAPIERARAGRRCAEAGRSYRRGGRRRATATSRAHDRGPSLRGRARRGLPRGHAGGADGPPSRTDAAVSVYPRYDKEAEKRMLVGFEFAEAAKSAPARSAPLELRCTRCGLDDEHADLGYVHAFTSSKVRQQFHSIVGITEIAHETVVAGAGYALVFLGLHFAHPRGRQPLSVSAAGRWSCPVGAGREGARKTGLGRCDVALQLGGARAARFSCDQRGQQRHQPARRLTYMSRLSPSGECTQTQLLTSGPKRSGSAGPNRASSSDWRSSSISSHSPAAPSRQ